MASLLVSGSRPPASRRGRLHPVDPSRMILAIEADGAGYRDSGSVRDRDRLRKEHLERLGWRVHRLWSTAWFTDPAGELGKLRAAFDSAVDAAPPSPPPPAPESPPEPATENGQAAPPEPQPAPRVAPQQPEATPPSEGAPEAAGEHWPLPASGASVGRAIPLGPGERPRLTAASPKALPAPEPPDAPR